MDNVISIDFSRNTNISFSKSELFLEQCRAELDDNDYADLIDAIDDEIFYETCDEDIQNLVISYFAVLRES